MTQSHARVESLCDAKRQAGARPSPPKTGSPRALVQTQHSPNETEQSARSGADATANELDVPILAQTHRRAPRAKNDLALGFDLDDRSGDTHSLGLAAFQNASND